MNHTKSKPPSVLERFSLAGKSVLLTGGAGLYGRGLAADLADAGARLTIASRNLEKCAEVASSLRERGGDVIAISYDQSSEESILELKNKIIEKRGGLHGLVNNSVARPMGKGRPVAEGWAASMEVNANGLFLMHHHFGPMLDEGGSIVNIGSIQGMVGPNLSLYKGTDMGSPPPDYFFHKGGMINLTRYYASHLGARGVRVNCLSPGGYFNDQPEPFVRRYCAQTALGRLGNDTDLGGVTVFLLSDASAYISGANIPVDGGYTAL